MIRDNLPYTIPSWYASEKSNSINYENNKLIVDETKIYYAIDTFTTKRNRGTAENRDNRERGFVTY